MKQQLRIFLVIIILLCVSNVWANKSDKAIKTLQNELLRLQEFRAEGIVQVNYKQIALRKNFVFSKNKEELRFDVIEGGIFGMQAEPLITIYAGKYLALRSPYLQQIQDLKIDRMIKNSPVQLFNELDSLFVHYQDDIIHSYKFESDGACFVFNKRYQLARIEVPKGSFQVSFTYTRNKLLDSIILRQDGKELMNLMIDKIRLGKQEIIPLPMDDIQNDPQN